MFPNCKEFHLSPFYFQANRDGSEGGNSDANNSNNDNQNSDNTQQDQETFEKWLAAQPDEIRNKVTPLYQAQISNLTNAVKATRTERDSFAKQFRDVSKKLEAGSDQQKEMLDMANSLDEANRRADFLEDAPNHECRNAKAAYAIAKAQDLFNKSGVPDWKAIQLEAPELFGKPSTSTKKKSAGSGTGEQSQGVGNMNDWIRSNAGVHTSE
jgi:hypothetical protein